MVPRKVRVRSSATCGGKRQWCLGSEEPIVPSHAWQKRREGLGKERLADLATLPHAGSRGFRA